MLKQLRNRLKLQRRAACFQIMSGFVIALAAGFLFAHPLIAQDDTIADDAVNAIAKDLYCPVCENIPLDVCPTQACIDWREDIREQLAAGITRQQIIDSFVARYGERVIGTPQDPFLRALALVTPWIVGLIALGTAAMTFRRWRGASRPPVAQPGLPLTHTDEDYRQRLENDLRERR